MPSSNKSSAGSILLLILAGEAVFTLPFVLARIFKPTLLEAFELSNTQLGVCFSAYGIVAAISYLFGGPIADRFSPKTLLAMGLFMTSAGGFYYSTYPSFEALIVLYGYWGMTTIFLFWAAMIKATRIWGGAKNQGKAFGFLDGGRGAISAIVGIGGVLIFSQGLEGETVKSSVERQDAFRFVILAASTFVALVGVLVLLFLKTETSKGSSKEKVFTKEKLGKVLKMPQLWYLMIIILCGYSGYKITENFSLFAKDILHYSEKDAAKIGTILLLLRPIVGIGLGFLADRTHPSKFLTYGFVYIIAGSALLSTGLINDSLIWLFFLSTLVLAIGVYAARVLYFALLEEAKFPLALTGTVVGLVSVIGYTPDIFIGPLTGYFLDSYDGQTGYQLTFGLITVFGVIGFFCTLMFGNKSRESKKSTEVID